MKSDLVTSLRPDGPEIPPHHPIMGDLYRVGPQKPLGYLPLDTITEIADEDITKVEQLLVGTGLDTFRTSGERPDGQSSWSSPALYAYDRLALGALLTANERLLDRRKWPVDPEEFARRVSSHTASPHGGLYDLIAVAFDDPRRRYQLHKLTSPDAFRSRDWWRGLGLLALGKRIEF